jgi:hypothetical protein
MDYDWWMPEEVNPKFTTCFASTKVQMRTLTRLLVDDRRGRPEVYALALQVQEKYKYCKVTRLPGANSSTT